MCFFSLSFLWIFLLKVYSCIDPHCWFPWRGQKKTQRSLWHKLFTRRCSTMNSWKHGMNVVCLWRASMLPCQQYVGPRVDFYMSRSAIFVAGGSWLRRRFSKISGWWCSSEKIDGSCFEPFVLFGFPKGTTLQLSMFWTFLKYSNEVKSTTI